MWGVSRPGHPALVPDRDVALDDPAVGREDEEPVQPSREPPVVRHGEHRALERLERVLQRLRRVQVEVVGRLVEEEQGRPGQLEEEDLESRLLATGQGVEGLLGRPGQAVAVQRAGGEVTRHPGPVLVAAVEDLEQGPPVQRRMVVGLREPAGSHPRAEHDTARVLDRRRPDVTHRLVLAVRVAPTRREQSKEV